ncbi:putative transcription factor interactor and regulator CCHC(Zn) family [Helianthus debilis subsp. tardiflorus]
MNCTGMAIKNLSIIILIATLVAQATWVRAAEHIVGDDNGWTKGVDYHAWATAREFKPGDKLGTSSEEEAKSPFWKQSNQAFLAEKRKNGAYVKKETRTCFRCNEAGHIAWNCPKATNTKQGVSGKLKQVVVDKTEPPTEQFKVFKNSTFEVGECSKRFYRRSVKLDNQKWVVKKSEVE